ncbi:MAG: CRISPR-associated endonuclease Cas1 [Methanobrevibacter sp.]|jgi:CRISPR-associated protein Cas1|nr:CRISPR-associated endonuclease Cas1 [Candidatus Methanovirga australis]
MRIIVDGFGKSVTKRDNQIIIKENGKEKDYFLVKDISQVIITGKGSITFDACRLLAQNDVDLIAINWKGYLDYRLTPPEKKNVNVKREQYLSLLDKRSGILAKRFIKAKIENQKATLGTLAKSRGNDKKLLEQRDKLSNLLNKLNEISNSKSDIIRSKIFGVEGQASVEYWNGIKYIIDDYWGFYNRSKRYAKDPVNSMLNYGYAILQGEIWRAIHLASLDPYCGFLHTDKYGRVSLVFDLMEEFRQQIVDKTVLSLVNKKQFNLDDFQFKDGVIVILEKARKKLISSIYMKLSSHINFNEKEIKYSDIIVSQARLVGKFLEGKEDYSGFYLRW